MQRDARTTAPTEGGEAMTKETWVTGLALFAMFFGAGNLIFPPYLGMESGSLWPVGLAFFVLIDVVMACVGIYALTPPAGERSPSAAPSGRFRPTS